MKDKLQEIVNKMASENGMTKKEFIQKCVECSLIVNEDEYEVAIDYITQNGVSLIQKEDKIYTKSRFENYQNEIFCIVDIETNGNTPQNSQIIEIGAIKYKNGKVVDRFESFVYCDFIPEYIEKITHISKDDLKTAPKLRDIILKFRDFLSSSIFVAHNVRFDYDFISGSLKKLGYGELLNRRLCTINLAKKTISSEKYGLSYLKDILDIQTGDHHRAYADALSALEIFKISLKNLPEEIESTEDLIFFSNPTTKKKKKKKEKS